MSESSDQSMLVMLPCLLLVTIADCMCAPFFVGCTPPQPLVSAVEGDFDEGADCQVCLGDLECQGPAPALCHGMWTQCTGAIVADERLPVCLTPRGVCNGLNACGDPPWPPH